MIIPEDFKEFLLLLNSRKVEYVIVGAYALNYYGNPRYTGDIDLFLSCSEKNAELVLMVLEDFGMGSLGLKKQDFTQKDNVIQLGYPPVRIDLVTGLSGVEWADVDDDAVEDFLDGIPVRFISKKKFIQNKKATGRMKDLGDIENLE